jgi:hypothetical protein
MAVRSDKLKKLEAELQDLEQWLKLGLVPKKDLETHEGEIAALKKKIQDEHGKLQFLKESGEMEEYVTPRKQAGRTQYTEAPTLPDMEAGEEAQTLTEAASETRAETIADSVFEDVTEEETVTEATDEEDPFSDRNRWKRGMLHNDDEEW